MIRDSLSPRIIDRRCKMVYNRGKQRREYWYLLLQIGTWQGWVHTSKEAAYAAKVVP